MSVEEKAMATHSSTLAWKIPWIEEPGRLQSIGSQRVRHDWSDLAATAAAAAAAGHYLNAEFQRIPRRDKKAFLSNQCKEIEESDIMGKTRVHFGRRQWHPTPVLLPGKSHGQGSLVGCGPWGHEESDTTERLPFHLSLSCIGEGNGNPLQCSSLENPMDGGAW